MVFDHSSIQLSAETSIVSNSALMVRNRSKRLSGFDIVLDVAGSGQHVPVVECKIRTIKVRVRAHKNSLPYIMNKLLLTMPVLFCVSQLNTTKSYVCRSHGYPNAVHRAQIDAARHLRVHFDDNIKATVSKTNTVHDPPLIQPMSNY